MALLLLSVCVMGYLNIVRTQKLVSEDLASSRQRLAGANHMVQLVLEQDMRLRQVGLLTDVSQMQAQAAAARAAGKALTATLDQLAQDRQTGAEQAMLEQARALDQRSKPVVDKAVNMALALQSQDAADILVQQLDPLSQQRRERLAEFARLQQEQADTAEQRVLAEGRSATRLMAASALAGLLLAGLAGWLVSRSVVRPLRRAVAAAERVAEGDLTVRLPHASGDEIGELLAALNRMADSLRSVISAMRSSSDSVLLASGEIAAGNHDLSVRTESQASSLQATASTIEQMSESIRSNAEAALQAARLAVDASGIASQGSRHMDQVVATMDAIRLSSHRIADIIGAIDGIAFQTNILALNAAVEAARAGEQGRGFAVVAGEVRALARRAAEAAREIKDLITANVEKVESGSRLVADAGSTMSNIVQSSQHVAAIIQEINHATQEQSAGLEQINRSILALDEATQQTAALVEQSAAAASSLEVQTQALNQAVSVFRMAESA